jgi:hypothetical protein
MEKTEARKLRADLSPSERERLEKYGSLDFKSAGATRQRYSPDAVDAANLEGSYDHLQQPTHECGDRELAQRP